MEPGQAVLEARAVSKRYGAVQALKDVSLSVTAGEIHAVLGENGAGKSTLMGVLSGFTVPDAGSVFLKGKPLPVGKPFECRRLGVGMIHQHFTLVPEFTVAENLALARLDSLTRPIRVMDLAEPSLELARQLGWQIQATAKVRSLPVGAQQRVEILKALSGDADVLIFDEPTAALSQDEVRDLFRVLSRLKDAGRAIVLIAHKLAEVLAIADRVTVLRKGVYVAESPVADTNEFQLAEWMVGHLPPGLNKATQSGLKPGLQATDVSVFGDRGEAAVRRVSFEVHRGEILGFGGVDGNGQVELAEALARVRTFQGEMSFQGTDPAVAFIPQDRQIDGLALTMSVKDNLAIGRLPSAIVRRGRLRKWAVELANRFDVRVDSVDDPVGELSGGNQQKVVVARVLDSRPDLLVALNPTRGLDIQATEFVHRSILAARDAGAAVALFSTDLDELAALATRTLFMSSGRLYESSQAVALVGGES